MQEIDAHIYKHEDGSLRLRAIIQVDSPRRFLSVGVAAEGAWEFLKELKQKLQTPVLSPPVLSPESTTFVKVSMSPEVEELVEEFPTPTKEQQQEMDSMAKGLVESMVDDARKMLNEKGHVVDLEKSYEESRRDVAGNFCCTNCGLATALKAHPDGFLCDICFEEAGGIG